MAVKPMGFGKVVRVLLLGAAVYYALWGGEYSAFDLYRLRQDRQAEDARLAAARLEVDSLRTVADRLENDPVTIERVARERFGMIKEGETLYRFIEVDSAGANGGEGADTP